MKHNLTTLTPEQSYKLLRRLVTDRSKIERACRAGMKNCIDAHGPITVEHLQSAAKRIRRVLKQMLQQELAATERHACRPYPTEGKAIGSTG